MKSIKHIVKKCIVNTIIISMTASSVIMNNKMCSITAYAAQSQTFSYTGSTQQFVAEESGDYKIQLYGASGVDANSSLGGYGGIAEATVYLEKNQIIYVCVGQQGGYDRTGYNGGGYDGGGGATHVAFKNYGTLNNYSSHRTDIILVAGGGGGKGTNTSRAGAIGNGGGEQGGSSSIFAYTGESKPIASQTSGYSFGNGQANTNGGGAGGGGFYGGYSSSINGGGGLGGSGYASSSNSYVTNSSTSFCDHIGDGYATISYAGRHKSKITLYNYGACSINGNSEETVVIEGFSGDTATLNLAVKSGYSLEKWDRVSGDCTIIDLKNIKFGLNNSVIKLEFLAPLISNVDKTSANSDIFKVKFKQADNKDKIFRVYESYTGTEWYEADVTSTGPNIRKVNEDITYTTVGVNSYKVKYGGVYTLDLYGASGGGSYAQGNFKDYGGNGGHTTIQARLNVNDMLYIAIGGKGKCNYGSDTPGGWNGGGSATDDHCDDETAGSGGGATHIALNANRGELVNYNSYRNEILAVAGGGGGSSYTYSGGNGGGINGGACYIGHYATQSGGTSGWNASFGKGTNGWGVADSDGVAGGGGGWYGGCVHDVVYRSGAGGGSGYVSTLPIIESGATYSGGNKGDGRCRLTYTDTSISATNGETTVEIRLRDKAAPNLASNGSVIDTTTVGWQAPSDNGSTVYHKVVSYLKSTEAQLHESNVTTDYVETGVAGYYYIVNNSASTIVNKSNSSYTTSAKCGYTQKSYKQYCHVAAIDQAGNLGGTYTFEIPVGITVVYNVNNTSVNIYGDTVTTTGNGNTPVQIVVPGKADAIRYSSFYKNGYTFSHWNTKSDNTGTQFKAGQQVTYEGLYSTYGARLDLYAIWIPIEYKIYYDKGLTSDITHREIEGATRNTDIQQRVETELPYTQARFDSVVQFGKIGNVLGREYTVNFDANIPKDAINSGDSTSYIISGDYAVTEKSIGTVNNNNPIKYTVHQYLPSDNKWKIEGADSDVKNNLVVDMGGIVPHPNYTKIQR